MPYRLRVVAFDLDAASLLSLRNALPEAAIEMVDGATAASLSRDWNPGATDLLVVQAGEDVAETLALCRFLVFCGVFVTDTREQVVATSGLPRDRPGQARRVDVSLLVLVPPGQEPLVRAALKAGADCCLILPVHAKEVARVLARARPGHWPDPHPLNLDLAQSEDPWRDDGGQG